MKGTVTRDEVLDLSGMLFAQNGYRATNLKLVADKLNVTRQALYYHFGSKADILSALFDKLMTKLEQAVDEAAGRAPKETQFSEMLRAHLLVIASNTDLAAILLHERPEIAKIASLNAADRRQRYTASFVRAYRAGVKEHTLNSLDPTLAVNGLLAAANAVSWWYRPAKGAPTPDSIARDTYNLLSKGFVFAGAESSPEPVSRARVKAR